MCRADDAGVYVVVSGIQLLGDVVHKLGLLVAARTFATPNVVEEHSECAHTEVIHCLQFVYDVLSVGLVPLNVVTRVYCPHKIHLIGFGCVYILCDFLTLCRRVFLTPFILVINIVFGAVDIYVHLLATEHLEEAHTVGLAVGVAIVTLDKTALRYVGIVGYGNLHHLWL